MQTQAISPATDIDMMRINATTAQKLGDMKKAKSLTGTQASPEKIDETAQDFEAQFISSMMENMFAGIDTDGPMGGGDAEKTYRSFMLDQYGRMIAKSGCIWVADYVKREMLRLQEVQS